jgi:hypothetical protein
MANRPTTSTMQAAAIIHFERQVTEEVREETRKRKRDEEKQKKKEDDGKRVQNHLDQFVEEEWKVVTGPLLQKKSVPLLSRGTIPRRASPLDAFDLIFCDFIEVLVDVLNRNLANDFSMNPSKLNKRFFLSFLFLSFLIFLTEFVQAKKSELFWGLS